jgi:sortase (surface protein transpeptidase)
MERKFTNLNELPVGARFYVHNGHWYGQIIKEDGVKKVFVEATRAKHEIKGNEELIVSVVE